MESEIRTMGTGDGDEVVARFWRTAGWRERTEPRAFSIDLPGAAARGGSPGRTAAAS